MKGALRCARPAGDEANAALGATLKIGLIVGWATAILFFLVGSFGGHLVLALVSVLVFSGLLFLESGGTFGGPRAIVVQRKLPSGGHGSAGERKLAVAADDSVQDAASVVFATQQPDFAVVQGDSVVGVVTRSDIIWALVQGAGETPVVDVSRRDVPRVDADRSFEEVGRIMVERNTPMVAVFDGATFLGLVKHSDIAGALKLPPHPHGSRQRGATAPPMTRKAWT